MNEISASVSESLSEVLSDIEGSFDETIKSIDKSVEETVRFPVQFCFLLSGHPHEELLCRVLTGHHAALSMAPFVAFCDQGLDGAHAAQNPLACYNASRMFRSTNLSHPQIQCCTVSIAVSSHGPSPLSLVRLFPALESFSFTDPATSQTGHEVVLPLAIEISTTMPSILRQLSLERVPLGNFCSFVTHFDG